MRKPRVIVFDDDKAVLGMLNKYFSKRNYEMLAFNEPIVCPVYETHSESSFDKKRCADILISDFHMPRMNGIDLLQKQIERRCQLNIKNKALISGAMDTEMKKTINELGFSFFEKPFRLSELSGWLSECERRMDLSQPLETFE
jgi:DNA-binding NtrC family response regulator